MAYVSVQIQLQIYLSFALLCFILGNTGLLSAIAVVAVLPYNCVRFS